MPGTENGPLTATITVPAMRQREDGKQPYRSDHWRRTVTGPGAAEESSKRRRAGLPDLPAGEWLSPGDEIEIAVGTLVLVVDLEVTGWRDGFQPRRRTYALEPQKQVPQKEADVAVHLVTEQGLSEEPLWEYHYMTSKSAVGKATLKKLAKLLEEHPAPGVPVTVLREAQRPNYRPGVCRWCGKEVSEGRGHLVGRGEDAEVEHYERCLPRVTIGGEECVLCGVKVVASEATTEFSRESGSWETRHHARLDCTSQRAQSDEEYQAEQRASRERIAQESRRERERLVAAQKRSAKRTADRRAAKAAALAAEREAQRVHLEQIAGLATVKRSTSEVTSKGLDNAGRRVMLVRYDDELEGGFTTVRWGVQLCDAHRPGVVVSAKQYDSEPLARECYRGLKYSPYPYQGEAFYGLAADTSCPGEDVPHCYHCGALLHEDGFWMSANTGPACGVDCYDAQADERGGHAERWHSLWP
ncbi:hypothetical protein ACFC1B_06950 [Streptomyces xiamenensis]|uniref:hypothetical protein n=1 Tax=Streptomyces xiamenensis TaxID=408015 RepID=UPI0035D9038E